MRFLRRLAALAVVGVVVAGLAGCASPGTRELTGDVSTHDPALAREGSTWYVYSTGNGTIGNGNVQIRSSEDGSSWRYEGEVWDTKPEWLADAVPGVDNIWAPELIEHDDTWYLYYSASTFGKNRSAIGLATNSTLDPDDPEYEWVDHGEVIASTPLDDFNAIDAGVAVDADGTPWMAFGSFWSGIRMVELSWPTGLRADESEPLRIADRGEPPNAIEAPYLVEHEGSWYLFVSMDSCCQASDSTYKIAVGRSDDITGPYIDREGVPLLEGGGTIVLSTDGSRIGPGGQSAYDGDMAFHFYNGDLNGQFQLAIAPIQWDADGWPTLSW